MADWQPAKTAPLIETYQCVYDPSIFRIHSLRSCLPHPYIPARPPFFSIDNAVWTTETGELTINMAAAEFSRLLMQQLTQQILERTPDLSLFVAYVFVIFSIG